jgi:hypothetical protein
MGRSGTALKGDESMDNVEGEEVMCVELGRDRKKE